MQELHSNAGHLFIGHTSAALMFFALIVPQPIHAAHPSIFFSSGDIPAIRTKATTSHSAIVQPILSLASSLLPLPVPTAPIGADYTNLSLDSRDVMALAFAFVATGDARYLALGRQYLAAFASWPYWGADAKLGDRDLSLGFMLRACAMAYDWLYDSLSTSDRAAVRAALVKHAQEMYEAAAGPYNADWGNWWPQSFGQNHWDNNITALGIAALALDGESDSSAIWLNKAVTEMRKDSFDLANIGDGTWHEGCLYQNSKLTASMPFYFNLKRLKGIDLLPKNYLSAYALYALYNYLPAGRQMVLTFSSYIRDWGGWLSAAGYSLLSLAGSACNSGYGQWLWNKMGTELGRSSYQAGNHIPEFFYYSPTAVAVPPDDLPLSRIFPDLEAVIWRTGWGANELVFGLKNGVYGGSFLYHQYLAGKYPFDSSGANLNVGHDHADANTFWLYRGTVTLIGENEGRSLYNDLGTAYQSSSHNTLLVDGRGQYFPTNQTGVYANDDGVLGATSAVPGYDFVESDASKRYRATNADGSMGGPMISKFVRNVLFVRPSYFVIVDNVADSAAHAYQMRFHFGDSAVIDTGLGWVRASCAGNNVVGVRTLAPAPFGFSEVDSILPAACIAPVQAVKRMDFAFVVYPSFASAWAEKPEFTLANQTLSATVVHVSGSTAFDHLIRHSGAGDTAAIGGYVCNGKAASVGKTVGGTVVDIFLANGALLADNSGSRTLLQSGSSVNGVHVALSDTAIMVYLDQQGGASLRIFAPGANPALVKVPGWNATVTVDGDYLVITGPAPVVDRHTAGGNHFCDAIFLVNGGKTLRFSSTHPGTMTASAFRLDGRCVWRSAPLPVKGGSTTGIPCDLRSMRNAVVIVRVEVNGTTLAQSLLRVAE
jgi:hypothetical protein